MNRNEICFEMMEYAIRNGYWRLAWTAWGISRSSGPPPHDAVERMADSLLEDIRSMLDRLEKMALGKNDAPGLEYVHTMRNAFSENPFEKAVGCTLAEGRDRAILEMTDPRGYVYNGYNRSLHEMCHTLLRHEPYNVSCFRSFLAYSTVVALFSKKTFPDMKHDGTYEHELGKRFTSVDRMFRFEDDGKERTEILFNLKNAFAHGRVIWDGS